MRSWHRRKDRTGQSGYRSEDVDRLIRKLERAVEEFRTAVLPSPNPKEPRHDHQD